MYYNLAPASRLYRVTGSGVDWPAPLYGMGAYFNKGGRYNQASQPTVYCAEDPLAVIAETAFYEALQWQGKISAHRMNPVGYPLVSNHKLWGFTIDPTPAIIDLEHPQALSLFQHTPYMLSNPSLNPDRGAHLPGQPLARDYFGTQNLATEVRGHTPPPGSPDPRPEGVKAPAIRLKRIAGYRPHMLALFVFPAAVHDLYENRSAMELQCNLQVRFLQLSPRQDVTALTVDIDWCNPQFCIGGPGAAVIPAYAPRPGAKAYRPNRWYKIPIQFA
jgi:RES domain